LRIQRAGEAGPRSFTHDSCSKGYSMKPSSRSPWLWAVAILVVIAIYFLVSSHGRHALDYVPAILLLACPLMHLFHGKHHHGSLGRHDDIQGSCALAGSEHGVRQVAGCKCATSTNVQTSMGSNEGEIRSVPPEASGVRRADITSSTGAAVLGLGVGALFHTALLQFVAWLLLLGLLMHGYGMYEKQKMERGATAVPRWVGALNAACWLAFAALAAYVAVTFLSRGAGPG
jgi:hypothetical protein